MAWTAPPAFTVGQILTSGEMNVISGDLSFLAGTTFNSVATNESSASTSYTNLATPGPSVSVLTGANALVLFGASCLNNTTAQAVFIAIAVSGATTLAAPAGTTALDLVQQPDPGGETLMGFTWITGLTPGANTFTMKYLVGGGTGTWGSRVLAVFPLP